MSQLTILSKWFMSLRSRLGATAECYIDTNKNTNKNTNKHGGGESLRGSDTEQALAQSQDEELAHKKGGTSVTWTWILHWAETGISEVLHRQLLNQFERKRNISWHRFMMRRYSSMFPYWNRWPGLRSQNASAGCRLRSLLTNFKMYQWGYYHTVFCNTEK